MRTGSVHEDLQRNVSNGFDAAMRQLEASYTTFSAPASVSTSSVSTSPGFEGLINYWHTSCGMPRALRDDLHRVRVWRMPHLRLDPSRIASRIPSAPLACMYMWPSP